MIKKINNDAYERKEQVVEALSRIIERTNDEGILLRKA